MKIILGTLNVGSLTNKAESKKIIKIAKKNNLYSIDTSPNYGFFKAEKIIGNIIQEDRKKFTIFSKFGLEKNNKDKFIIKPKLTKSYIIESINQSLRNLKTNYLDVMQIHAFNDKNNFKEVINTLVDLKKKKIIKKIGCVNFDLKQILKFEKNHPRFFDFVQLHFNFYERKALVKLIPYCVKNKKKILINRFFASGIVFSKKEKNSKLVFSKRLRSKYRKLKHEIDYINKLLKEYDLEESSFYLNWLKNLNFKKTLILGFRTHLQIKKIISNSRKKIDTKLINRINKKYLLKFKKKCISRPLSFHE